MKYKIASVILLCTVIISVWINTVILERSIGKLMTQIEAIDIKSDSAFNDLKDIYEKYKNNESYFSLTVSHDDLTSIEECFVEVMGYMKNMNVEDADVAKSRLRYFLEHLKRLSGLNIDSII